jgi:hypothetical protein
MMRPEPEQVELALFSMLYLMVFLAYVLVMLLGAQ